MFDQASNLLLASLSPKYCSYVMSRLRPTTLGAGEVLYEADESPKLGIL
jgi:hypothetical protein